MWFQSFTEYAVVPPTGQTGRVGPTGFGLEWLIGDRTVGELLVENGLDDDDEVDTQWQRTVVVQRGNLAIHRDQPRRIRISQSVQFPAPAIPRVHKNAPVTEFGASVQKRADAGNA